MDIAKILSRAFSLYKKNLKFLLPHLVEYVLNMIAVFFFLIVVIIAVGLSWRSIIAGDIESLIYGSKSFFIIASLIFGVLVMILAMFFFYACARGAIIGMAKEGYKEEKTFLDTGLQSAKKFGIGIFFFQVILSVIFVALFSISLFPIIFSDSVGAFILLVLISTIVFLLFYFLTLFAPQKIVVEEKGVIQGISESIKFVRSNFVAVLIYLGISIGMAILGGVISAIFYIPVVFFSDYGNFSYIFARGAQNIATTLLGLVIAPYLEIVKTYMVIEGSGNENKPSGIV